MGRGFGALLRKDFKLMLSGKFFLLAAGSLLVYSFYINMVYVRLNQEIYPVIVYDPLELQNKGQQPPAIMVESQEELQAAVVLCSVIQAKNLPQAKRTCKKALT